MKMKKILLAIAFISLVTAGLSSCKSSENCPAYTKATNEVVLEKA